MARCVVVLTYDLATPPGLHERFREEMKKLHWMFEQDGNDLPETTCTAKFKEGNSREDAAAATKSYLVKVSAILVKEDKGFKIKRYMIMVMDEGHFKEALKDIG